METERITLSQRGRDRLKVLHEVQQRHLTQVEAAARLKVTDRQVRRMPLRIREHGDGALVHGLRGRPSNRKLAARLEQKVLARVVGRKCGHKTAHSRLGPPVFRNFNLQSVAREISSAKVCPKFLEAYSKYGSWQRRS